MNFDWLLNNYILLFITAFFSIVGTLLTQNIINRRARFRYSVTHDKVGVSTDHAVFGSIRVTWNGNTVSNLYSSTIELANESMKDFENIVVSVFTSDTILLTQRTDIVDTIQILEFSPQYADKIRVPEGSQPTQEQYDLFASKREFIIPVMNRGQHIRFTFLNAAKTREQPSLWLDILHKGIKLEFGIAQNEVLGVSQSLASLVGSFVGMMIIAVVILFVPYLWLAALITFIFGLFAQIPGAYTVRAVRAIQRYFGG